MTSIAEVLVNRRRQLIVRREDVMTVLDALEEIRHESRFAKPNWQMNFGACVDPDEPPRWFITFDANDRRWKQFIEKLACVNHEIILKKDDRFHLM